jgi:nitroreductase
MIQMHALNTTKKMDALTALHTRNSINLLCEPGPNPEQLNNIIKAGLRACDHHSLTPWKFLLIEGKARDTFGELMVKAKEAAEQQPISSELARKIRSKPLRAPTILVVVAAIKEHQKVPEVEQVLSAGAAAQMMMTAAHAQGVGAIWRSGSMMFTKPMRKGLNLAVNDQIVGFIYLGTAKIAKPLPMHQVSDFLQRWTGE